MPKETLEIVADLVASTYLDSTTSTTLKYEVKYFNGKTSKSLSYCLAYSAKSYSHRNN